jgi:hypothetical protein
VILLDSYIDRGSLFPPLGFKAADVTRVNAILIGHGHADHMSDAAAIGSRTGALVVGAPVTTEKLLSQSMDGRQVRTVTGRGGELLEFRGMTVEPILGRHSIPRRDIAGAFDTAMRPFAPAPTPEQQAEQTTVGRRGTNDPRVGEEGTIAYLITLDTGFRIMYRDSAGAVTDYERAAMARIGVRRSRFSRPSRTTTRRSSRSPRGTASLRVSIPKRTSAGIERWEPVPKFYGSKVP